MLNSKHCINRAVSVLLALKMAGVCSAASHGCGWLGWYCCPLAASVVSSPPSQAAGCCVHCSHLDVSFRLRQPRLAQSEPIGSAAAAHRSPLWYKKFYKLILKYKFEDILAVNPECSLNLFRLMLFVYLCFGHLAHTDLEECIHVPVLRIFCMCRRRQLMCNYFVFIDRSWRHHVAWKRCVEGISWQQRSRHVARRAARNVCRFRRVNTWPHLGVKVLMYFFIAIWNIIVLL